MVKNILILCGGKSVEHEVSIISARNVLRSIDKHRFHPIVVLISRSGTWYLASAEDGELENVKECTDALSTVRKLCTLLKKSTLTELLCEDGMAAKVDVVFPLVHGTVGEDGSLQGMMEALDLPYVGSPVLASALGMDKTVSKVIFANCGIEVTAHISLGNKDKIPTYKEVCERFNSTTFFVKSSTMGSSVGVYKVRNEAEYLESVRKAFLYCPQVLVEKYVKGREIECAVLGNDNPKASILGEIRPRHDFYSYEAKYLDPDGAELVVPAAIPEVVAKQCQELAIRAFKAIGAKGMARVDFFLTEDNKLILNEINTIPGFTQISMYPILWQHSGFSYEALISRLIELALEEFSTKGEFITHADI